MKGECPMELYGKKRTVRELRRRIGNMDQVAGIRSVQFDDGNERPSRAALVHTGSGLEFTILLDRCLDIAAASYKGKPMGWRSRTGDVAPQYFEPEGIRWLRSFTGGLVSTCGLTQAGAPGADSALQGNGLHGRIGNTPARDIAIRQEWQGKDYVLQVSGTMREAAVFGENLSLRRTVSTKLGESRFWIQDVVTNEGFNPTKYMLLYHCNIGWPAVEEGAQMIAPSRYIAPRDGQAAAGKESWNKMEAPTHNYAEKCYYHDMVPNRDGSVTVAMANKQCAKKGGGLGVYVRYNKRQLPRFVEWKQMGEQDYVVGFEPCNCGVEGRQVDEQLGLLHSLRPGESKIFDLELGAIDSGEQLNKLKQGCSGVSAEFVDSYRDFVKAP